jgi:hypothetical protein
MPAPALPDSTRSRAFSGEMRSRCAAVHDLLGKQFQLRRAEFAFDAGLRA